jgi:hypothetical protein
MKKIGIVGSGIVAQTLGEGFVKNGYKIKLGTRHPEKLEEWQAQMGLSAEVTTFEKAAEFGDIIILAIKGHYARDVVLRLGYRLNGKTVIDTTNPIDDSKDPEHGVLSFFSEMNKSLMEVLQETNPQARFVKCFSCIGAHLMVDPHEIEGLLPTMFICGNDDQAKLEVAAILKLFGHETEDMGNVVAARAIEPLCMLWCIPGFRNNEWSHAIRLLKP